MPLSLLFSSPQRRLHALLLRVVVVWGFLLQAADAVKFITESTSPAGISTGCRNALTADVPCSLYVSRFRPGYYYTETILTEACTAGCEAGLLAYENSVVAACSGDTWEGYDDDDDRGEQLGTIPSLLRYLYSVICLRDSDRWCNVLAGIAAQAADPGNSPGLFQGEIGANVTVPSPCDLCFVKSLRIQASVPYFDGPALVDALVYENKTSSCSIQNMPRTTSTLGITLRDGLPTPTPTPCAGTPYQIQPGDDCHKISLSQHIGTGWLLSDNKLGAWCHDFPTTGSLCIDNKCDVVTVPANATCKAIAKAANTTEVLLKAWNPVLNAGCYNIEKLEGHQLCVSPPGPVYVDPSPGVLAPTTASTAAPLPTDIANGTNPYCGKFYQVQPDEYCNLLVVRFGIALSDFLFLNPALNANCTNLFAFESYCIEPVGDINTYPGQVGAIPTNPVSSIPFVSVVPIVPSTTGVFPAPTTTDAATTGSATPTSLPIAPGTRGDCIRYFDGSTFQDAGELVGTRWINQCQRAADVFSVNRDDFAFWNSDLANITTPACAFNATNRYCRKLIPTTSKPAVVVPDHTLPIREGAISTCTQYADVTEGWTCAGVLEAHELTIAQFFAYNPAVGADCSGLWPAMAYCIRAPGYTSPGGSTSATATATASSTSSSGPPGPTHTGQPANCNKWHLVASGDTCATVPPQYGITLSQFLAWNPAVNSDCTVNFWLGQAYCVGVSGATSPTPTSASPTSTATGVVVPSPVQAGNAVANCNRYAQAQDGDWCALFATRNSVTLANLYAWNTVLGADGSGCGTSFWSTYWYCIGVA